MDTLYFCMVRNYSKRYKMYNYLVKTRSLRKFPLWTLYGHFMDKVYLIMDTMDTARN